MVKMGRWLLPATPQHFHIQYQSLQNSKTRQNLRTCHQSWHLSLQTFPTSLWPKQLSSQVKHHHPGTWEVSCVLSGWLPPHSNHNCPHEVVWEAGPAARWIESPFLGLQSLHQECGNIFNPEHLCHDTNHWLQAEHLIQSRHNIMRMRFSHPTILIGKPQSALSLCSLRSSTQQIVVISFKILHPQKKKNSHHHVSQPPHLLTSNQTTLKSEKLLCQAWQKSSCKDFSHSLSTKSTLFDTGWLTLNN